MAGNSTIGIEVILPIGIEDSEGKRYTRVMVDEMCGVDEENLAAPAVRNNASKANTVLLQRLIQSVPGLIETKKDRYALINEDIVRSMYQADRDAAIIGTLIHSPNPVNEETPTCPHCGAVQPPYHVDLRDLKLKDWPDGQEAAFAFELPRGIAEGGVVIRNGKFRFPRGRDVEEVGSVQGNMAEAQTRLFFRCMDMTTDHFILSKEQVRYMTKYDRDYLGWMLRKHAPGFDMSFTLECVSCGKTIEGSIDIAAFFDSTRDFNFS